MTDRQAEIIELIHKEVKPALGCTEPVAVALAAAKAVELLGEKAHTDGELAGGQENASMEIRVEVSGNILKNGMGVGIPGTGMIGLKIAAALGAVCGKSAYGLEVLKELDDEAVAKAQNLTKSGLVSISLASGCHKLYVKVTVSSGRHSTFAIIEDVHDRIVATGVDEQIWDSRSSKDGECSAPVKDTLDYNLTIKEIFDFSETVDYEDIKFILDDKKYNLALAEEGLSGNYGLNVGKSILADKENMFGDDFLSYAMALTAAASDARMAGCTLPAMSNSGSGNQGITVSMPVIAYALKHNISDERLARALIMSNLVAIHIKGYLGRLSALCGCVIASTGASCGLVWLKGGNYEQVCAAIKNMIGNITGMVCDGAKVGCAMKVASGVSSSVQSAMLALNNISVCETDGIIDKDIEKTIANLGNLGSSGMEVTDTLIQKIMVCK